MIGVSTGTITFWPLANPGRDVRFSSMVFPVTVMQLPLMKPFSRRYFITAGVPPMVWTSSITYCNRESFDEGGYSLDVHMKMMLYTHLAAWL